MFSPKLEGALQWASLRHAGQTRKASEVPYFTHLAHVALILAREGDDDETLIAALLHDVIEDTTRNLDERRDLEVEIERRFGPEVRSCVAALTEPKRDGKGRLLPWLERKQAYLHQLERAPQRALRVSAADKLHNLETLLETLAAEGASVWERFRGGPVESRWFYGAVLDLLARRLPSGDRLVARLQDAFRRMGNLTGSAP